MGRAERRSTLSVSKQDLLVKLPSKALETLEELEAAVLSADIPPRPTVDAETPVSVASRVERQPINEADFEVVEIETPDTGQIFTCQCPCGDDSEISEEVSTMTTDRCGAPRCKRCFPGRGFDVDGHRHVRDLALPKYPGITAEQIMDGVKKAGKS